MTLLITILIIAGLCKAVKDRLDNPYTPHIFPYKGKFWNRGTGKKFMGWFADAWHISDLIYISCFCIAIALYYHPYGIGLTALLYFAITQVTFNIFYFIFKKR
jgi:hypothetical protein